MPAITINTGGKKMKTIKPILVVAMVLLLGVGAAQAGEFFPWTVIWADDDPNTKTAIGIENLVLTGGGPFFEGFYNVEFKRGHLSDIYGDPPTFNFNSMDDAWAASDAVTQVFLGSLLLGQPVFKVAPGPVNLPPELLRYYLIPYGTLAGTLFAISTLAARTNLALAWETKLPAWHHLYDAPYTYAVFTKVHDPETPCKGDLDNDGDVDLDDWNLFLEDWGRTDCPRPPLDPDPPCKGDLNWDGEVDEKDLVLFINDWERTDCPPPE
jgi:hypothetical protein